MSNLSNKGQFFRQLWEIKYFLEENGREDLSQVIDKTFERFIHIANLRSIERIQQGILSRIAKNSKRKDISTQLKKALMNEDRTCLHFCDEVIGNAETNDEKIAGAKEFVEEMRKETKIS